MSRMVQKLFKVNLAVMHFLGFYPKRKYRKFYKLYSFMVYWLFTTCMPVLTAVYLMLHPAINFEKFTAVASVICEQGIFIIKTLPLHINDKKIRNVIYMIEKPIFTNYSETQERFMENCQKICLRMTHLFLCSCSSVIILWAVVPFLEKKYKLPMDVWLPFDWTSNMFLYILAYVYIVVGAGYGAVSNGAVDTLIAGLALYATTQIRILKDNLEKLDHGINTSSESKKISVYKQVKQCIQHHNEIIQFVSNYEEVFSLVVFSQFSASVLVICISCLNVIQTNVSSFDFAWSVAFVVAVLTEIFLFCYPGTILFEESNSLTQAVYMGNWYEYDLKSKKTLITFMERAKKPIVVTAGKILDLSLNTFTTILRRAYSLLAVLKNFE